MHTSGSLIPRARYHVIFQPVGLDMPRPTERWVGVGISVSRSRDVISDSPCPPCMVSASRCMRWERSRYRKNNVFSIFVFAQQKQRRQPFGFKGSIFHRAIPGFMVQVKLSAPARSSAVPARSGCSCASFCRPEESYFVPVTASVSMGCTIASIPFRFSWFFGGGFRAAHSRRSNRWAALCPVALSAYETVTCRSLAVLSEFRGVVVGLEPVWTPV